MDTDAELIAINDQVWADLATAASPESGEHPFRFMQLATLDEGPSIRTVVLRAAVQRDAQLVFYSDARAPKIAQVAREPRVAFHCYDPQRMMQVRMSALARRVDAQAVVEEHWRTVDPISARNYASDSPPGMEYIGASGVSGREGAAALSESDARRARGNFAVVVATVTMMDWLKLGWMGHERIRFSYSAGELIRAVRVQP